MISIKLTNKEISYLKDLAKKRHYAKHPSFRDSSAITSHKNFEPHFLGILGEYAWGKYTNQSIDTFIYDVRDFGEDFKNTEVKAITYEGRGEPELKIPKEEFQSRTSVLLYVLVKIKKDFNQSIIPNEIQILGTISRKDFEKSKISKQYREGYPENFIVPLSKMNQTKKNVFVNLFSPYEECFPPGVLLPEINIEDKYYSSLGCSVDISNFDFLNKLCEQGFNSKNINKFENFQDYIDRYNYELKILEDLGFTDYILLNWDIINYCKDSNIPVGPGRGSAAGSLVLYLIGVTDIDPVKYELFFEKEEY